MTQGSGSPTNGGEELLPSLVAGLATEVRALRREVRFEMSKRPTKWEVASGRIVAVVGTLVTVMVGMQLYNRLTETCGVGGRTERAVFAIIHGQIHSSADLARVYGFGRPARACDIAFPLVSHAPGVLWPSGDDLVGVAVWLGVMALMFGFAVAYRRKADIEQVLYLDNLETEEG